MRRLAPTVVLLALVLLYGANTASASSPGVAAHRLAQAYHSARTTSARKAAILGIARAIKLGVYKGSSLGAVVKGAAGPKGPYLYDFEVTGLADATRRHARLSFSDIADTISAKIPADDKNADHHIVGDDLRSASALGIRAARSGRIHGSKALVPLLADAIAKLDGVDLPTTASSRLPVLDPMLGVLAVADVTTPLAFSKAHPRSTQGQSASNPCESLSGGAAGAGGFGQWIIGAGASALKDRLGEGSKLAEKLGKVGDVLLALNVVTDAIHGIALGYSMGFTDATKKGENATAFGFAGYPRAGQSANLKAKLEMLDSYSTGTIRCGALLGYTIPPQGPVSGARVSWSQDKGRDPSDLGVVSCPASTCQSTDGDGISTWKLQPDDEIAAGQGAAVTENIIMTARVAFQGASGNKLGGAAEFVFQKEVISSLTVRWDQPEGYHFDIPSFSVDGTAQGHGVTERYSFSGMDQCTSGVTAPHPTYPKLFIGYVPGIAGSDAGSKATADRVDHEPGADVESSSSIRPFIINTGIISPGKLPVGSYSTLGSDWGSPTFLDDGVSASFDAGYFVNGLQPAVGLRFTIPGASPGQTQFVLTPSTSSLCAAARPLISATGTRASR